ncbi:hypothetical protein IFM89_014078 [Coptis chinensis]|uniref:Morc S5 domain-containing protein n=1 Tax=Coptis chinensis TaxID=261450 RepID=A0A835M9Z0_9MAGN|nr:hypothetical protein IFM89_014078 [Coptis chinensis]
MSFTEVVDLCSDDDTGEAVMQVVKEEPHLNPSVAQRKKKRKVENQTSTFHSTWKASQANGGSNALNTVQAGSATNGSDFASNLPPAPLCRQFWKAGTYNDAQASKVALQAIAELLDNALDEVQNGASFVMVDKTINPRDGCPALIIQDDGGGMDPESMRRCISFGFSDKKSKSAIGQYGNGFKTSTMRLGADAIVFSRHTSNRTLTQSVGLLSYTFLRQTGHDRIVVPIVDYEFEASTGKLKSLSSYSAEHFSSNMSMLLQWSPYGTESELLKQFDNMGHHGTKVIIYNLWFNDERNLELDFESDAEDILITGAPTVVKTSHQGKMITQHHIATRFPYSLRVYSAILYLKVPKHFRIILRGKVVEHHSIANDLKFPQCILYKPQIGKDPEAAVITTIGFLKDAPHVNIHGFSVYHKNRLIMPFWRVVSQSNNRGRGVAGVLEANFIEPTHNKQDFEKTSLFQKLEARLKDMTLEYWDYHCGLIGYHQPKKSPTARTPPSKAVSGLQPVTMTPSSPALDSSRLASGGRSLRDSPSAFSLSIFWRKTRGGSCKQSNQLCTRANYDNAFFGLFQTSVVSKMPVNGTENQLLDEEAESLIQENRKLQAQCLEYEKREEELNLKVEQLKIELLEVQHEYARLLSESKALEDAVKNEKM